MTSGPFGGYSAQTEVQIQASQDEVIANLNKFKALFPDMAADAAANESATPAPHPDFNLVHPLVRDHIRAEIDAIIAVVDAAPIA